MMQNFMIECVFIRINDSRNFTTAYFCLLKFLFKNLLYAYQMNAIFKEKKSKIKNLDNFVFIFINISFLAASYSPAKRWQF
jgi:hypothetical protein